MLFKETIEKSTLELLIKLMEDELMNCEFNKLVTVKRLTSDTCCHHS